MNLNKKNLVWIHILAIFVACSGDSSIEDGIKPPTNNSPLPLQITGITKTEDAIYQTDINTSTEEVTYQNLTSSDEIGIYYDRRYVNNSQVSFIDYDGSSYSAIVKDVKNKTVRSFPMVCDLVASEDLRNAYLITVEDWLLVFTEAGEGETKDIYVWSLNMNTGNCNKLYLGKGLLNYRPIAYENNKVLIDFYGKNYVSIISCVDLISGEIASKEFTETYEAMLYNGQVHMFFCSPNQYKVFSIADWSELDKKDIAPCSLFNEEGVISSQFNGNELLIDIAYPYPHPTNIKIGPGIFDLNSGTITEDKTVMYDVKRELEETFSEKFMLSRYKVDFDRKIIAISFFKPNNIEYPGSIVLTSFDGEIIKHIPLKFSLHELIIIQ